MKISIFSRLVALGALATSSLHAKAMEPADLVGTWELVSYNFVKDDGEGGVVEVPWCTGHAYGLLIYTSSNYMSVALNCTGETLQGTSDRLLYSGKYTVKLNEGEVIHHVMNSSMEGFLNQDQVRYFELENDELILGKKDGQNKILFWLKWKKLAP